MLINIVTWSIVHSVVRCLVGQNFVRDDLMVTNLIMTGQNILMNKTRFVDNSLVKLILMEMSSHVFFIEFLRNLNVS